MSDTRSALSHIVPICPDCQADLAFVCSWPSHGPWGYQEIRTYECAAHGPVFIGPETAVPIAPSERTRHASDEDGDRWTPLVSVPRKPAPSLDTAVSAVPEPDPGSDPLTHYPGR